MGLSIKVFDWMSKDINEWEEIKKGNLGVALIFVAMILVGWPGALQSHLIARAAAPEI